MIFGKSHRDIRTSNFQTEKAVGTLGQTISKRKNAVGIFGQAISKRKKVVGTFGQAISKRKNAVRTFGQAISKQKKVVGTLGRPFVIFSVENLVGKQHVFCYLFILAKRFWKNLPLL